MLARLPLRSKLILVVRVPLFVILGFAGFGIANRLDDLEGQRQYGHLRLPNDALGNVASGFTGSVTLAIANNAGGGTLSGTASQAATAGVATFANLSINRSGVGYKLSATAGLLPVATSAAFDIAPAAATRLAFTVQPTNATAGQAVAPPLQVTAQDAFVNLVPAFTGNVTVAIGTNPGVPCCRSSGFCRGQWISGPAVSSPRWIRSPACTAAPASPAARWERSLLAGDGGEAQVNMNKCIGCGLCVPTCPPQAVRLKRKDAPAIPPMNEEALNDEIMSNKKGAVGQVQTLVKAALKMKP